jgi:ABC-type transporter Mla maintaining outer membrane lipid asymmetry permease subunit MlaE
MSQSIMDRTNESFAEAAQQATRATGAIVDAIDDGVGVVRHAAKQGCDAAEQFLDETTRRLQRHVGLTVAVTFAVGATIGAVVAWLVKRK